MSNDTRNLPSSIFLPKSREVTTEVYKIIEMKTIVLVLKKNKSKFELKNK